MKDYAEVEWRQGYNAGFNLALAEVLDTARQAASFELVGNKYFNRGLAEGRLDRVAGVLAVITLEKELG